MGKKKWTGHGKRNHKNANRKGKGKFNGNAKKSNQNNGNRFHKSNHQTAKTSNPNEEFHSRMEKFNLMEKDIGVTEYVGSTPGFNAVIKSRFSDFQVNEIDLDGNVVKLTDTKLPTIPEPSIGEWNGWNISENFIDKKNFLQMKRLKKNKKWSNCWVKRFGTVYSKYRNQLVYHLKLK